jgi:hypothetical protein
MPGAARAGGVEGKPAAARLCWGRPTGARRLAWGPESGNMGRDSFVTDA